MTTTQPNESASVPHRIPLFRPTVPPGAQERVAQVLQSSWLGLGPVTEQFEAAFGQKVGSDHVVAVNSGTAALHLALRLAGAGPSDEVVLPANTFIATGHAVLYEGAMPVFADINPNTGNIDPEHLQSIISPRTAAIIIVHYAGTPCDLDAIYDVARRTGIAVIEDCAHACGAEYRGRPIGSAATYQAFSFHATKNLATGEGGALVVPDADTRARAARLRRFGIDKPRTGQSAPASARWDYAVDEVGFKYNMSDIHAAIGLAQLDELDEINAHRTALVRRYTRHLRGLTGVRMLDRPVGVTSGNFVLPVLVEHRDELMDALDKAGIETGVHFRRIDSHPMYTPAELPQTEWFWRRTLSLPVHAGLCKHDVDAVCGVITEHLNHRSRAVI